MLDHSFVLQLERLQAKGIGFCLATIVDGRGSIPQVIGARAIFTKDGLAYGTVGGGTLEVMCQKKARELLLHDQVVENLFQRYNLHRDLGMTCGGEVALYFEVYRRELDWNIVIFGAGHVAQTLCRFLIELDCHVICVDTRDEWLDRLPRSEKLETCHVRDYRDGVERIDPGADVILMTMGHSSDLPILKEIERRKLEIAHLGVIGSDSKSKIVRKQLGDDELPRAFIDKIICPLGEKIGNNTPAEIAVGIVSQLLRLRHASHQT